MSTSPSSATREAQRALGARLRQIRKIAGLSARELAAMTDQHYTRVSKIETGVQQPTEADIRAWCICCGAEDQVNDFVAELSVVNSSYREFRSASKAGMQRVISLAHSAEQYEATRSFCVYEHNVIPGLLQTEAYTRSMLEFWVEFLDTPMDIEAAMREKAARQRVLRRAGKRFTFVLEEQALRTWFGSAQVQREQLLRLSDLMSLPTVSVGIIPLMKPRFGVPSTGYWVFDDSVVLLDTPTAAITVTRPSEVALYVRMFDRMHGAAVHGSAARALIAQVASEIV